MSRTSEFTWIAGVSLVLCCAVAGAQPWPAKPVRIVVPYAPGGTIDIIARQLGEELFRSLGRAFIVENLEAFRHLRRTGFKVNANETVADDEVE